MTFNVVSLAGQLEGLGLEVPQAPGRILAVQRACSAAVADRPVDDLEAAIDAGTITPKGAAKAVTEAAMRLASHQYAQEVVRDLQRCFTRSGAQATRGAGDEIVAALRTRFDPAIAELIRISEPLGPNPTRDICYAAGPQAAELWNQRERAMLDLAAVRRARLTLALSGYGPAEETPAWYVDGIRTHEQYGIALQGPGGSKLIGRLCSEGYVMRLATATEAEAMLATVESSAAAERRRQTEAEAARKAEHKAELERRIREADPVERAAEVEKHVLSLEVDARRANEQHEPEPHPGER